MYYVNRLKKIAKESNNLERILFTVTNKKDNQKELEDMGFNSLPKDQPAVAIVSPSFQKYKMDTAFSIENVQSFVKDFLGGKVKLYVKSDPIPTSNDGPVTVVVGQTFNEIVMDPKKDVLIEFYAPWCGHCKNLEPIFNSLGEEIKKEYEGVVIAKMDATSNDATHSQYKASGYPTILFAPAGGKDSPISYSGERKVKDFVDFLKKNAKMMKKNDSKEL